jgi:hypothetical protein
MMTRRGVTKAPYSQLLKLTQDVPARERAWALAVLLLAPPLREDRSSRKQLINTTPFDPKIHDNKLIQRLDRLANVS